MISVMIPPFLTLATHAQVNKVKKLNESTQVKSTQEQLEEAFEEQVCLEDFIQKIKFK